MGIDTPSFEEPQALSPKSKEGIIEGGDKKHSPKPQEESMVDSEKQQKSPKLIHINDVLDSLGYDDQIADKYRAILQKRSIAELKKLTSVSKIEVENLLVVYEIDYLRAKGFKKLSKKEKITLLQLRKKIKKGQDTKQEVKKQNIKIQDKQQEAEDTKQEVKKENYERRISSIKQIINSHPKLKNNSTIVEINKLFDVYDSLDISQIDNKKEVLNKIISLLKKNLVNIVKDLGGADTSSPDYISFKNQLVGFDTSFHPIFDKLEAEYNQGYVKKDFSANLKLGTESLDGIEENGNSISQNNGDINIKVGENGRSISLVNGDYRLPSNFDNQNLQDSIREEQIKFSENIKELDSDINTLTNLKKGFSQTYNYMTSLDQSQQKVLIQKFKNHFLGQFPNHQKYLDFSSLEEMKQKLSEVDAELILKQEERLDLLKSSKAAIQSFLKKNAEDAKEKDERHKETLKFLNQIGFDLIPQEIIQQILREYKTTSKNIPGITLNKKTINLAEGKFGEGVSEDRENGELSDTAKENLVAFMEKLIYGQVGVKESVFKGKKFKGELAATINPTELKAEFEKYGIVQGMNYSISKIRTNLFNKIN